MWKLTSDGVVVRKYLKSIIYVGLIVVGIFFLAGLGSFLYLYWYVNVHEIKIADGQTQVVVEAEAGTTARDLVDQAIKAGMPLNPEIASRAFTYYGADKDIKQGRYRLESNWTLKHFIDHIASGDVLKGRYTIVEGTRTNNFLDRIQSDEDFKKQPKMSPEEVMEQVGAPGVFPEGQFAAATYTFNQGAKVLSTLQQAYHEQQKRLERAWKNRDPDIAVKNSYELLILASIIEKETGNKDDRELISSVFNNRLKKGMLLQTDPTVIYGIENFQGKILKSHLKTDHPYNTYLHAGLPPTPIAIPGEAAIEAAAHPAKTDYLYFVAMADGSGKSHFSTTLKEHNEAVRKYLRSQGK
ncbi:MAG: endolytic transglycosylase MltG [Burkholderiales bacterium]|nr:endolytic transglycosylase MltG [Burkholderiales bacterium]